MSARISVITTCKDRLASLSVGLPGKIDLLEEDDELIVVDLACPLRTGEKINRQYAEDPRVCTLTVPDRYAGPFWDPGLARNLGARAARGSHLLFLDADVRPGPGIHQLLAYVRSGNPLDMAVTHEQCLDPDYSSISMPQEFEKDGQILISQPLFVDLNGFVEEPGWGAEVYDLILRVSGRVQVQRHTNYHVAGFGYNEVEVTPHSDDLRRQHLPMGWSEGERDQAYIDRAQRFERDRARGVFRAQQDRPFGGGPRQDIVALERRGTVARQIRTGDTG